MQLYRCESMRLVNTPEADHSTFSMQMHAGPTLSSYHWRLNLRAAFVKATIIEVERRLLHYKSEDLNLAGEILKDCRDATDAT